MDNQQQIQEEVKENSNQEKQEIPAFCIKSQLFQNRVRFPQCQKYEHEEQLNFICLHQQCKNYMQPLCNDCMYSEFHQHENQYYSIKEYFSKIYKDFTQKQEQQKDENWQEKWLILAKNINILTQKLKKIHEQIIELVSDSPDPYQILLENFKILQENKNIESNMLHKQLENLKEYVTIDKNFEKDDIYILKSVSLNNLAMNKKYSNYFFRSIQNPIENITNQLQKIDLDQRHDLDFSQTKILGNRDCNYIQEELKQSGITGVKNLAYQMSRDGKEKRNFHDKCDNIGPHVIFIKSDKYDGIIGAYIPDSNVWTYDDSGYVGTQFKEKEKQPFIFSTSQQVKCYSEEGELNKAYQNYSNNYFTLGRGSNLYLHPSRGLEIYESGSYKDITKLKAEDGKQYKITDFEVYELY